MTTKRGGARPKTRPDDGRAANGGKRAGAGRKRARFDASQETTLLLRLLTWKHYRRPTTNDEENEYLLSILKAQEQGITGITMYTNWSSWGDEENWETVYEVGDTSWVNTPEGDFLEVHGRRVRKINEVEQDTIFFRYFMERGELDRLDISHMERFAARGWTTENPPDLPV